MTKLGIFLSTALAISTASAVTLDFNGTKFNIDSVTIISSSNKVKITTSPVVESPVVESPVVESPVVESPVVESPDTCGLVPPNVQVISSINWASPGSQTRLSLGQKILSMPLVSTENPSLEGQVSIAATTGTSGVKREVWFSKCPGTTFNRVLNNNYCGGTGTSNTIVRWSQKPHRWKYCDLGTNQKWYLNIRNINCNSTNCDVYRNIYRSE